jgi:hypothetical protein
MAEIKDVYVCGGCGTRTTANPETIDHFCAFGKKIGWARHVEHDAKCDLPMCRTTAEWLAANCA